MIVVKRYFGSQPLFPYRLEDSWQACQGHDPIGPMRTFQRDAIGDLPPEAAAYFGPDGRVWMKMEYRVRLVRNRFSRAYGWPRRIDTSAPL